MVTKIAAAHFSPALFSFLRRLDRNNDRAWFEKNKERYLEDVRDPMLRFVADFAPRLRRISPHLVADPRGQGGSMLRIYRDLRFSKDPRPYKTAAAAHFRHEQGRERSAPGFYLHLGAKGVYAGAGIWRPDGATLAKIRGAIVAEPAKWKRMMRAKALQDRWRLDGESLKRPPRGFDADHPLIADLMRKDHTLRSEFDEEAVCAPDFIDQYAARCRACVPFMRFLAGAIAVDW